MMVLVASYRAVGQGQRIDRWVLGTRHTQHMLIDHLVTTEGRADMPNRHVALSGTGF